MTSKEELRQRLQAIGFDAVRFARVSPGGAAPRALKAWLDAGFHADMQWIERGAAKREQPDLIVPGAKSWVLLGVNYGLPGDGARSEHAAAGGDARTSKPIWARYALYEDYHDTIKAALERAGRVLEQALGLSGDDYRYYVDTGPVLERAWAERAGLGFIGKNAMLISRDFGNWLFLAAILTRTEIEPDEPLGRKTGNEFPPAVRAAPLPASETGVDGSAARAAAETAPRDDARVGLLCGKCTRCIDACPTNAIVSPGVVDARKCVSYQTIENKGVIPRELRAGIGSRVYGCDICAEVCPWNRFAQESRRVLLTARYDIADLPLREILRLTPERFAGIFKRTPMKRVKLAGLLRNACIVAGNTRATGCLDLLVALASHESALVRVHAVWAVQQVAGVESARALLAGARGTETDAQVLAEYAAGGLGA
jgi:epoxyqueuosine reductase